MRTKGLIDRIKILEVGNFFDKHRYILGFCLVLIVDALHAWQDLPTTTI